MTEATPQTPKAIRSARGGGQPPPPATPRAYGLLAIATAADKERHAIESLQTEVKFVGVTSTIEQRTKYLAALDRLLGKRCALRAALQKTIEAIERPGRILAGAKK
jgi:hypothetical protein